MPTLCPQEHNLCIYALHCYCAYSTVYLIHIKATTHYMIFTQFSLARLSPTVARSKIVSLVVAQISVVDNPHSSRSQSSDNSTCQIFTKTPNSMWCSWWCLQGFLHSREHIRNMNIKCACAWIVHEWLHSVLSLLSRADPLSRLCYNST